VGTCHGVVKRIAPDAEVIDITHGIAPQNVLQGALVLASTLPYMPDGIHLAVVDPGVGGDRMPLALRAAGGRLFVGPDNGLLLVAADRLGGVEEAVELARREYMLEPVSATFHGRDVFAPAAAHLARGVPITELGPPVPVETLARLEIPRPRVSQSEILATVLDVDRFGNVQLNVTGDELEGAGIGPALEVAVAGRRQAAVRARTFADVAPGETVVYEDAYGSVAIAVNGASAAQELAAGIGTEVALRA
jgi:S-adenosyl-L-methionine hydrolase (adenosine-forming)